MGDSADAEGGMEKPFGLGKVVDVERLARRVLEGAVMGQRRVHAALDGARRTPAWRHAGLP